jgi:hypothetical protein
LVPDLVETVIAAPPAMPCSASKALVAILVPPQLEMERTFCR